MSAPWIPDLPSLTRWADHCGASAFSGSNGVFPDVARWREELLTPLERTARWLRERGTTRIALSGSYRLTTAFALGYSLRSAAGFERQVFFPDGFLMAGFGRATSSSGLGSDGFVMRPMAWTRRPSKRSLSWEV